MLAWRCVMKTSRTHDVFARYVEAVVERSAQDFAMSDRRWLSAATGLKPS